MFIPIPISVGATYEAAVEGTIWKLITCESCGERYAYGLNLEATGEEHDLLFLDAAGAMQRAQEQAQQRLAEKCRNVVLAIPCPNCGHYQEKMARRLKDDASVNPLQIIGGIIVALAFVPLLFSIANIWILTAVLATIGLVVLAAGCAASIRFDPNDGNPEERKELGRSYAVWGEQLPNLLATNQYIEEPSGAARDETAV